MSILDMTKIRPVGDPIGPERPGQDPIKFIRILQETGRVVVSGRGGRAVTTNLDDLRRRIRTKAQDLKCDQDMLARQEATCTHNRDPGVWEPPVQRSREVTEHLPDYNRLMEYGTIPRKTSKSYWTRRCGICGMVEETTRTRTQATEVPDFSRGGV